MMFNPTQLEVRQFFINVFNKGRLNQPFTPLEEIAYSVILEHKEYHYVLEQSDKYLDYQWNPEQGEVNPFLHLSFHLTVIEQISIDQPPGIVEIFNKLCRSLGNKHDATHAVIECLGEMIWQSQKYNLPLDHTIYFSCLANKVNILGSK